MQIREFGLKHRSRELAALAGVPMTPGTGLLSSLGEALARPSASAIRSCSRARRAAAASACRAATTRPS